MLCRRSASFIRTARASAIARNIVCRRSASTVLHAVLLSRASLLKWLNFDTPSTRSATPAPNIRKISS
uniref:Uncharacterized protein n=1 Tax=Arundo donax TaxID=35708 RepID=A0A0A9E2N3_ARUDO